MTDRPIPMVPMDRLLPENENLVVDLVDSRQNYGEILPEEVVAICKLARSVQPKRIFEFGTFRGGTTLRLAANTEAEIFTFDLPPQGHPDFSDQRMDDPDLDVYPETPGVRFLNTPYAQRIHQIYGDSQAFDFSTYFGTMDFVFVDACHHFEFALRDSMNAFKMIRPGGTIVWHDYAEWAPGVMRALKTVCQRYPLFHISGTSLVVYNGEKDVGAGDKISADQETASARRADLLTRLARWPGNADALVDLARMEMVRGNTADALAFAHDALIIEPDNPRALALKSEIEES